MARKYIIFQGIHLWTSLNCFFPKLLVNTNKCSKIIKDKTILVRKSCKLAMRFRQFHLGHHLKSCLGRQII